MRFAAWRHIFNPGKTNASMKLRVVIWIEEGIAQSKVLGVDNSTRRRTLTSPYWRTTQGACAFKLDRDYISKMPGDHRDEFTGP